jgi:cell division protease FtsH
MQEILSLSAIAAIATGAASLAAYIFTQWDIASNTNKIYKKNTLETNFDSVAGNTQAKEALQDIVNYLKDPTPYHKMGARVPKGILLYGPSGTGKTLLARALAGEAQCNFIVVSGSSFNDKYIGVGAERIRSLFKTAKSFNGPCIIFIDEIDALIRKRNADSDSGSVELANILNELLTQMDGFEQNAYPIIVIGATNRLDVTDPAATRPGRFDRIVSVQLPTMQERTEILKVHIQTRTHLPTIDLAAIAQITPGFSGAELENLINEAAITAINHGKSALDQTDLEAAWNKVQKRK